jgi:hypothetical protein
MHSYECASCVYNVKIHEFKKKLPEDVSIAVN